MVIFVTIFLIVGSIPFVVCGWQFYRGKWRMLLAKSAPEEELGIRVPKDNELRVASGLFLGTGAIMTFPTTMDVFGRRVLSSLPQPVEIVFGALCVASLAAALIGLLTLLVGHFRRKARERRAGLAGTDGEAAEKADVLNDYDEERDNEESIEYVREKLNK